jgi:hypothetical protein
MAHIAKKSLIVHVAKKSLLPNLVPIMGGVTPTHKQIYE